MNADIAACAGIVRRADPDRFATMMAAPVLHRRILAILYAFNAELARAPWASQEPMIAEMRLQWWHDAIEAEAKAPGVPHEIMTPLGELMRDSELPTDVLTGMVAARQWDIYREPHADDAAFWAYLDATGGALMWLSMRALWTPEEAEPAARALGTAHALANYLRAVPKLEQLGRIPLVDGTTDGVTALARKGLDMLDLSKSSSLPKGPALAAAWTRPYLKLALREPGLVAAGQLDLPEFTRRRRLLWQAMTGWY